MTDEAQTGEARDEAAVTRADAVEQALVWRRMLTLLDGFDECSRFCERLFFVRRVEDIGALLLEYLGAALGWRTRSLTGCVYLVDERTLEFEPTAMAPAPEWRATFEAEWRAQVEKGMVAYAVNNRKIALSDTVHFPDRAKCVLLPLHTPDQVLGLVLLVLDREQPSVTQAFFKILTLYGTQTSLYVSNLRLYERLTEEASIRFSEKTRSLEALAGGIAHDFNNLLVGMMGNAELMLVDLPPHAPHRRLLEDIKTAAQRASVLTDQILAYAGRGRSRVQPVQLNRVAEDIAHLLRASLAGKVECRFELDEALPRIEADAVQMQQVVLNLIVNAQEAIGAAGGVLTIATGVVSADAAFFADAVLTDHPVPGRYVFVRVTDTGVGMSAETRSRMFDPFFTTKFMGRGLGLSAVLGIVRAHRGTIKVQSALGQGTAVQVFFPCARLAPSEDGLPSARGAPGGRRGGILVIDDEERVRNVARMMLTHGGYQVATARDGEEGTALFRARPGEIALILLDMTMPGLTTREVLDRLRVVRGDVPVILMSGFNEQAAQPHVAQEACAGFLHKPFDLLTLLRTVGEFVTP